MDKKSTIISILIILIVLSSATISTTAIKQRSIRDLSSETINRQVDLGFASIIGNGGSSTLEAVAENDLSIGLGSESGYVDFYINYNMNCSGTTDEGAITLTIFLNDQNTSFNLEQTPTAKNGILKIENVEVHRQDNLLFMINVGYISIIPLYSNSTSANGIGIFNKGITVVEKLINPFLDFLEQHPRMFLPLRHLLKL